MVPKQRRRRGPVRADGAGLTPVERAIYRMLCSWVYKSKLRAYADRESVARVARQMAVLVERLPYGTDDCAWPMCRKPGDLRLTAQERRALVGVAQGLSRAEIGDRIHYTEEGVKSQLRTAYRALGARNAANAVMIAFTAGILTPEDFGALAEDSDRPADDADAADKET